MAVRTWTWLQDRVPGVRRIGRLPRQVLRISPFAGSIRPTRVPLISFASGRPSLPFPHPWNYDEPLRILETFFWNADAEQGPGRHNRYLEVPGFDPILVTRDPRIIRVEEAGVPTTYLSVPPPPHLLGIKGANTRVILADGVSSDRLFERTAVASEGRPPPSHLSQIPPQTSENSSSETV